MNETPTIDINTQANQYRKIADTLEQRARGWIRVIGNIKAMNGNSEKAAQAFIDRVLLERRCITELLDSIRWQGKGSRILKQAKDTLTRTYSSVFITGLKRPVNAEKGIRFALAKMNVNREQYKNIWRTIKIGYNTWHPTRNKYAKLLLMYTPDKKGIEVFITHTNDCTAETRGRDERFIIPNNPKLLKMLYIATTAKCWFGEAREDYIKNNIN